MTKNDYIMIFEGRDGVVNTWFMSRELGLDHKQLSYVRENARVIFEGFVSDWSVYHDRLSPLTHKPYSEVSGKLESIIKEIRREK